MMRRSFWALSASLLILLSVVGPAAAAAPSNDHASGATVLTPGVSIDYNSSEATIDATDPTTCDGSHGEFPGPYYASVWFTYTAKSTDHILYLDAPTTQGDPDDYLAITFVYAVGPGGTLELIDCTAYGNEASWAAVPGTTYLIMEAGLDAAVTGEPDLSNKGGHGTITLYSVSGRMLTLNFDVTASFDFDCPNVDLSETFTFHDTAILSFRADGSIRRVDDHITYSGVITNNDTGATYRDPGHSLDRYNVDTGVSRTVGLIYNITIPGQGVVALDAGYLSFDAFGNVTIHGPHEVFDGLDLCEVLA
jgi:hypothetical protein